MICKVSFIIMFLVLSSAPTLLWLLKVWVTIIARIRVSGQKIIRRIVSYIVRWSSAFPFKHLPVWPVFYLLPIPITIPILFAYICRILRNISQLCSRVPCFLFVFSFLIPGVTPWYLDILVLSNIICRLGYQKYNIHCSN